MHRSLTALAALLAIQPLCAAPAPQVVSQIKILSDKVALVAAEVPAGTRDALVRYTGTQANTANVFNFRIDADYKEPRGGFAPVKVTYVWEENGGEKRDEHIASEPSVTYIINCASKPVMKSLIVQLAE